MNYISKSLLVLALISTLTFGQLNQAKSSPSSSTQWHYGGFHNSTRWGELSDEFKTCAIGKNQSPINLGSVFQKSSGKITFNYRATPLEVVNNGHTIQVNYAQGSTIEIDGKEYELVQFHFHTPSEHTVNNKAHGMEVHLVHKNEAGELAVVGVLITAGSKNPDLAKIWKNLPQKAGEKTVSHDSFDASKLLPTNRSYYSYTGSLTTPPCSEGVSWSVFTTPIEADAEQMEEFMSLYNFNTRPVQPINSRQIEYRE